MKVLIAVALLTVTAWAQSDVAKEVGIYEITKSWSANVADFNDDGWPDVLIGRHYGGGAKLYRNDKGTFTEVYEFPWKHPNGRMIDRHDCAWGDVNRDGLLDIYCTEGSDYGTSEKQNELWIAQPDGTFLDEAEKYGVTDPWGRGRFCTFIDVNKDGWPDLFVANETGRADKEDSRNHLFVNEHGSFRPAPEYGLDLAIGGGQCVKTGDIDNDGYMDLLVCAGGSYPRIYHNNKGIDFSDISLEMGVPRFARDVLLVDLDGDSQLDIASVNRNRFQVRLQRNGVFEDPSFTLGMVAGEKLAAGDINRDGLPEIYICQGGDKTSGVNLSTNPKDIFLLNNGDGQFSTIPIPEAWQGQGQHVSPIDVDRDGKTDWIVLNGFNSVSGPIQLIKW